MLTPNRVGLCQQDSMLVGAGGLTLMSCREVGWLLCPARIAEGIRVRRACTGIGIAMECGGKVHREGRTGDGGSLLSNELDDIEVLDLSFLSFFLPNSPPNSPSSSHRRFPCLSQEVTHQCFSAHHLLR